MREYCDGECDQGRRCDCERGAPSPITTEMKVLAALVVAIFCVGMAGVIAHL
jgi:hypothetical protein